MRDYRPTQCFAMEERRNAVGRMLHHILLHIPQAGSQCFGFFTDIQQGNFAGRKSLFMPVNRSVIRLCLFNS